MAPVSRASRAVAETTPAKPATPAKPSGPDGDLGFATLDHDRARRQGMPEAVYAPGKTPEQCAAIVTELLRNGTVPVLLSRASAEQLEAVPEGASVTPTAHGTHTAVWRAQPVRPSNIVIVTAGTADGPVADECAATLAAYGLIAAMRRDCGVAGIHRVLAHTVELQSADAIVVVAGMEGALASVVGGLSGAPIIAVPTSVGYGSSLEGVTALLAMMSSCAAGVTVVGIDNGYGAACAVTRMVNTTRHARPSGT